MCNSVLCGRFILSFILLFRSVFVLCCLSVPLPFECGAAVCLYGLALEMRGGFLVLTGANSFGHLPGRGWVCSLVFGSGLASLTTQLKDTCPPGQEPAWLKHPAVVSTQSASAFLILVKTYMMYFFFVFSLIKHGCTFSWDAGEECVLNPFLRAEPYPLGLRCLLRVRPNVKVKPTLCFQWRGGGEADGTHRLSALRRITDNWRVMLSRSPADRCQSTCSKSRGYALLFFPYTAINPVFSPICEECRRIPMTHLRRAWP